MNISTKYKWVIGSILVAGGLAWAISYFSLSGGGQPVPQQDFSTQAIGERVCTLSEIGQELKITYQKKLLQGALHDRQRLSALNKALQDKIKTTDPQTEGACLLKQLQTEIDFILTNYNSFFRTEKDVQRYLDQIE